MTSVHDDLINFWRRFSPGEAPFVHPDDKEILLDQYEESDNCLSPYEYFRKEGLKLRVLPSPILGDLRSAKIYILMLNPGFGFDSIKENECCSFRFMLKNSISQNFQDSIYKFPFLDPDWCWTGGFSWWYAKFKRLLQEIEENTNCEHVDAMRRVANGVATVELFPYPSSSFSFKKLSSTPSVLKSQAWLASLINSKYLIKENKMIVVCRRKEDWKLEDSSVDERHVFLLDKKQRRGGWFCANDAVRERMVEVLTS